MRISELAEKLRPYFLDILGRAEYALAAYLTQADADDRYLRSHMVQRHNPVLDAITYYSPTAAGLAAAIGDASSGETIWVPPGTYSGNLTIPAGVTLIGLSREDVVLTGQIGASTGAWIENLSIVRTANDTSTLIGLTATAGTVYAVNCDIDVQQAGSGTGYAIYEDGGEIVSRFCYLYAESSGASSNPAYGVRIWESDTDETITALSLWNGSSNDSPPANWYTNAFDDSAWGDAVEADEPGSWYATPMWATETEASSTDECLMRHEFTLPDRQMYSARIRFTYNNGLDAAHINGGSSIHSDAGSTGSASSSGWITVDTADLNRGASNLIAVHGNNTASPYAWVLWELEVTMDGGEVYACSIPYAGDIGEPEVGDRSAFDVLNYPARHANDIEDGTYEYHNPLSRLLPGADSEVTISSGEITVTQCYHRVDTEGDAASDDLDTISGLANDGELLILHPEADARTVVVKHGTGNIYVPGGSDITMDEYEYHVLLVYDAESSSWCVLGAGAGGGSGTDEKVKISSNDTTEDYLLNKLAAGAGISLTETNDGGDEDVTIAVDADASEITYTPTTLADWDSGADPGETDDALDQLASRMTDVEDGASKDVFTATAATTVANTVTETTLFGSGEGSLTLAADYFTAGRSLRIHMRGQLGTTGTPTINIKVKLGSTVIASMGATALTGVTDVEWMLDVLLTCRSAGASGSFIAGGLFDYDDGSEISLSSGTAVSVDTTASQTLDVTITWGTADASNTITTQEAIVEMVDPNAAEAGGTALYFESEQFSDYTNLVANAYEVVGTHTFADINDGDVVEGWAGVSARVYDVSGDYVYSYLDISYDGGSTWTNICVGYSATPYGANHAASAETSGTVSGSMQMRIRVRNSAASGKTWLDPTCWAILKKT